jgi:hypothetical protein
MRNIGERITGGRSVENLDQIVTQHDPPGDGQIHELPDDQRVRERRPDVQMPSPSRQIPALPANPRNISLIMSRLRGSL